MNRLNLSSNSLCFLSSPFYILCLFVVLGGGGRTSLPSPSESASEYRFVATFYPLKNQLSVIFQWRIINHRYITKITEIKHKTAQQINPKINQCYHSLLNVYINLRFTLYWGLQWSYRNYVKLHVGHYPCHQLLFVCSFHYKGDIWVQMYIFWQDRHLLFAC